MADLGTVAAILQLVETAYKLWKIFAEVRDAPTDLVHIVEEIKVIADLLSHIQQTHPSYVKVDQKAWESCYRLFRSSTDALRQVTDEMESTLKAHRKTGPARLYLRKNTLAKCQNRLASVKGTMILAQSVYSIAIRSQEKEAILQEIRARAVDQRNEFDRFRRELLAASGLALAAPPITSIVNLKKRTDSKQVSHQQQTQAAWTLDIRVPRWIIRRGVQVLINRGNSSWGMTFRVYNRLPKGSEVFNAAKRGNWDKVDLLIRNHCASPYDINEKGQTLLHVAAGRTDIKGCKLLQPYGLDINLADEDLHTPLDEFQIEVLRVGWSAEATEAFPFMMTSFGDLVIDMNHRELHKRLEYTFHEAVPIIMSALPMSYSQLDRKARAEMATCLMTFDSRAQSMLLGPDLTWSQALSLMSTNMDASYHDLLETCAVNIVCKHVSSPQRTPSTEGWKDILKQMIQFTALDERTIGFYSPLPFLFRCHTALDCTLGHCGQRRLLLGTDTNNHLSQVLREYVAALAEQGANLERYGRAEHKWCSNINRRQRKFRHDPLHDGGWFELMYVTYGPRVEDWSVFVKPATPDWDTVGDAEYEMAGGFWQFTENPGFYGIPGSWTTDDDDIDHESAYDAVLVTGPIF